MSKANTSKESTLTVKEAAFSLKKDPYTVRRYCRLGVIRAEKVGRDWYIPRALLEKQFGVTEGSFLQS